MGERSGRNATLTAEWRIDREFRKVAQEQGSAPAIELSNRALSYAEVDMLSSRLGRRLLKIGVRAGDLVALGCEDVAQFAIGALAIMKAGAAYVPIDLRFPSGRGRDALAASAVRYAIAPYSLDAWLGSLKIPTLVDAFDFDRFSDVDGSPLNLGGGCSDIAYLCYTSGTSGAPKGALIPHQGVFGLTVHEDFSALGLGKRVASCSTFAFDAITFEVWCSLLGGACIVAIDKAVLGAPRELAGAFRKLQIDGAFLTTSLFNAVVVHRSDAFGGLSLLVIGGEAIDPSYVRKLFEQGAAPARVVNGYGPTEATTFALTHVISPDDVTGQSVPIGRALPGRYFRILKDDLTTAAFEEPGELCLGGPALAAGYLNAPELTNEKFIKDPFATQDGARLYRTGDLCFVRCDGLVEYVGRLDDQVKIRGYRVEPLGVAALLRQIPEVEDAVVLSRPARFGTKEIVAFLRGASPLPDEVLRAEASRRMADYMVPMNFVWVEDFPLTLNGKIDAERLLAIATLPKLASCPVEDNATPLEALVRTLTPIWQKNTCRAEIEPDVPYDEVGDSFGLIGILLDVEAELGAALSPHEIEQPITVRNMARYLAGARVVENTEPSAFYISPPWIVRSAPTALADALAGEQHWAQLHLQGLASPETFRSVEHLAMLLQRQLPPPRDDCPITLAGHSFGGVLAYELARQLEARDYPIARVVLIDSHLCAIRRGWDRLRMLLMRASMMALSDPARLFLRANRIFQAAAGSPRPLDLIFDRSIAALQRYEPGSLQAPVLLVRCGPYKESLDQPKFMTRRWFSPWEQLLTGLFETVSFNCTHSEIIEDPLWVSRLASAIRNFRAPNDPKMTPIKDCLAPQDSSAVIA